MIQSRRKYIWYFSIISSLILVYCTERKFTNPADPENEISHPQNLSLVQEGEWLKLKWDKNDQIISGYEIERWTLNGLNELTVQVNSVNQLSFLDTTLTTDVVYNYRMRGISGANMSGYSEWIDGYSHFPSPFALSALFNSDSMVILSWQDTCDFEDGFEVYRKINSGSWQLLIKTTNLLSSYSDDQIVLNNDYYYQIRGYTDNNSSVFTQAEQASDIPTSGLIAYYPFNGNANDESGNGYDGILSGPDFSDDRFGSLNKSCNFDSYLEVIQLSSQILDGNNLVSLSLWIKKLNSYDVGVLSGSSSYHDNEFLIYIENGVVAPHIKGPKFFGQISIEDGTWHHIVVTRNSADGLVKIFIDGVLDTQDNMDTGVIDINQNGLWLGNDQDFVGGGWTSSQQFIGQLDDIRIYNRILSEQEIIQLYHEGG